MNPVTQTIEAIVKTIGTEEFENTGDVKINREKLDEFCTNFDYKKAKYWMDDCPIDLSWMDEQDKLAFLFVFNSSSFSYWNDPEWKAEGYEYEMYRGTWNMLFALNKAIKNNRQLLDPNYLSTINEEELGIILKGNIKIPLLKERAAILRELGKGVVESFNSDFNEVLMTANYDAIEFVKLMVSEFPTFNDSSVYKGHKVCFYKRAQLLASDISNGFTDLSNSDKLTALADYIEPMALRQLRIFEYSPRLAHIVNNKIEIPSKSEMENEIRIKNVYTAKLISKRTGLTQMQINDALWNMKSIISDIYKHHRTRGCNY